MDGPHHTAQAMYADIFSPVGAVSQDFDSVLPVAFKSHQMIMQEQKP